MHLLSVLVVFLGGLLLVKGTGENTCTSTAVISITTNVLSTTAAVGPVAVSVPTPGNAPRSSIASFATNSGPLVTSAIPSSPQATSTIDSIFSSVLGSVVSGVVASSLPVSFGSGWSNVPTPKPLPPLTGSSLNSLESAIESSTYPYTLSFGPGGGIKPTNATTLKSSTSTATSTSSASASTTSTSTSSAAATTTSAQGSSGAVATAVPAAKGANLALAVVAAVMLLL